VTRIDEDGTESLFGSVRVGGDVCQISTDADGETYVKCTPESHFPEESDAVQQTLGPHRDLKLHFGFTPDSKSSVRGSGGQRRKLYDNSGANIDIMVAWTMQAECAQSRLAWPCTLSANTENSIRGLIDLAVLETNTAFALSGIATSLRLVHAYRDSSYVESTTNPFYEDLYLLTDNFDGKLDSVHAKRSLYGADAVVLIICKSAYSFSQ
jgi:hypothetical protein